MTYLSFLGLFAILFHFVHCPFPIVIMVLLAPWSCCVGNFVLTMILFQYWSALSGGGGWKTECKIGWHTIFSILHTLIPLVIFCSKRSLPLWTLLAVLWQMCHVCITAWSVTGSVLVIGRPSYPKQKSTIFHVFRGVYGCSTMPETPSGCLVGLSQ